MFVNIEESNTKMKTLQLVAGLIFAGIVSATVVGCTSSATNESTGEYIDDAAISNKVRAQLIGDKDLNIFKIDVTTFKGDVQLSGFVDSAAIKTRAGSVAAGVSGVRNVHNNLVIK